MSSFIGIGIFEVAQVSPAGNVKLYILGGSWP